MAKTPKKNTETSPAADAAAVATLRWVGPAGHTSPTFGELVPGRTYTADATFAAYLVATHPEFWQAAAKE